MSEENVELVRGLQPAADVDLTELFNREDEAAAETFSNELAPLFTDDFVAIFHAMSSEPRAGLLGLRELWLDWLEPWESYRVEFERISDAGERVLLFSRDFGRRPGTAGEVELKASAVWTVRDGKVSRAEFFTERADALRAAGLAE
jgi:ketosteroid isomerase-like protein